MLRRLLACLALITGLAATGMPAQAAVYQAVSAQTQAGALADRQAEARRPYRPNVPVRPARRDARPAVMPWPLPVPAPAPVIPGVDRAHE